MNVGILAGNEPHQTCFTLSGKTVSLLATTNADLTFTVYACPRKVSSKSVSTE